MYLSTLAPAVALAMLAQQASAAGFIEDSKSTFGLRNFYFNTDNRDSAANSEANKKAGVQSKNEEWGQGFDLRFISGYTQGTVSFGIWIRAAALTAPLRLLTAAPFCRASLMAKQLMTSPVWA